MNEFDIMELGGNLELPFELINISDTIGQERFIFQFEKFDKDQSEYSIKNGGITGEFGIIYIGKDINCHFLCDVTVGNVYDFFIALDDLYEGFKESTSAIMENYGTEKRTRLSFEISKRGYFNVNGFFLNKSARYKNGITLSLSIPYADLADSLSSMNKFFHELKEIQGHNRFY